MELEDQFKIASVTMRIVLLLVEEAVLVRSWFEVASLTHIFIILICLSHHSIGPKIYLSLSEASRVCVTATSTNNKTMCF